MANQTAESRSRPDAASHNAVQSDGELKLIPVDLVDVPDEHPRKVVRPERLAELRESMQAEGILTPVRVMPAAGGRFNVICGSVRVQASKDLNLERIPALIVPTADVLVESIVDNLHHEGLTPFELAEAFNKLAARGHNDQEIADLVKIGNKTHHRSYVACVRGLDRLQDKIKRAVHKEHIGGRDISFWKLVELSRIKDPEVQWGYWELVRDDEITTKQLGDARRKAVKPSKWKRSQQSNKPKSIIIRNEKAINRVREVFLSTLPSPDDNTSKAFARMWRSFVDNILRILSEQGLTDALAGETQVEPSHERNGHGESDTTEPDEGMEAAFRKLPDVRPVRAAPAVTPTGRPMPSGRINW